MLSTDMASKDTTEDFVFRCGFYSFILFICANVIFTFSFYSGTLLYIGQFSRSQNHFSYISRALKDHQSFCACLRFRSGK